jgi:hypothetical protein
LLHIVYSNAFLEHCQIGKITSFEISAQSIATSQP